MTTRMTTRMEICERDSTMTIMMMMMKTTRGPHCRAARRCDAILPPVHHQRLAVSSPRPKADASTEQACAWTPQSLRHRLPSNSATANHTLATTAPLGWLEKICPCSIQGAAVATKSIRWYTMVPDYTLRETNGELKSKNYCTALADAEARRTVKMRFSSMTK